MKTIKYYFYSILNSIGLSTLRNVNEAREEQAKLEQRLKNYNIKWNQTQKELSNLKKRLKIHYPKNRKYLKKQSGKELELTGVYIQNDSRGILVRYIQLDNKPIADHLWLDTKEIPKLKKGTTIRFKGVVTKYGSMSYQKNLTESYGITEVIYDGQIEGKERLR